jgi:hypothetical protein
VADLGVSPLSNALLTPQQLNQKEKLYPLQPYVCESCWLVQLPELAAPEIIFSDYTYFSSYSETWLRHVDDYAAAMVARLGLGSQSLVVEVGSNDGHLLKCFLRRNVPVLGIEPAANIAAAALRAGVRTEVAFFGVQSAETLRSTFGSADLIAGNNVLAHVPKLNDFIDGLRALLKQAGTITMEFPHLLRLIEQTQFDTIYHEHYSYFSLSVARRIFAAHRLTIYDVEELPTHGGSLRIFATHNANAPAPSHAIALVEATERAAGLQTLAVYERFASNVYGAKKKLLEFFAAAHTQGATVAGYGAPAKATTLLNYCGIDTNLLPYTVDRNPIKVGKYIPGVRIPIEATGQIKCRRPDYVLILPWNWAGEIREQMSVISSWGGRFVVPIPTAAILA